MAGKTVTRVELSKAIYRKLGLSRTESSRLVEEVLGEISNSLVAGKDVRLFGFGSFLVRSKDERAGRNPTTRIEVIIEKRRVMVFRPSDNLKGYVNGEGGLLPARTATPPHD